MLNNLLTPETYSKFNCRCVTRLLSSNLRLSGNTTHFFTSIGMLDVKAFSNIVKVRLEATTTYHRVVKSSNSPWQGNTNDQGHNSDGTRHINIR